MSDRLFPLLLLLTLLDLGFVQATGVVSGGDLLPLWGLTLAAPWLRRLQRHLLHRVAWNGGVLVVFVLLVQHATTSGLLHMLEDGLVLAVLCQVHLVNNIGRQQRPDLIFFNSFLIAFVTSFFAPDLPWSLLFVLHAFVLVPSLQVHAFGRGDRTPSAEVVRTVLRASVRRTLAIGTVTALVFVVWPRDFRREGLFGEALALRQQFEAGLADRIRIDDERPTRLSEDLVLEVVPPKGLGPADLPTHWRGLAFSTFDGTTWLPQDASRLGSRLGTDPLWRSLPGGVWQRDDAPDDRDLRVEVRLHDLAGKLPTPLAATELRLPPDSALLLDPKSHGGFATLRGEGRTDRVVAYTVALGRPAAVVPSKRLLAHFTAMPDQGVPSSVHTLATQLREERSGAGLDADPLTVANTTAAWLGAHRRYQLPGGPGFAKNLGAFVLGSGAGHCEYFATTLALLLRAQGVPCRLVGGYLAAEWDAERSVLVARSKHAHAWVEVLDTTGHWRTVDPTPAADLQQALQAEPGIWTTLRTTLEGWWAAVTGFGQNDRARWLQAMGDLPRQHPLATGLALALLLLLLYRARRRRRTPFAVVHLRRAIRATGLELVPGETPRELLVRAAATAVPPARLARLRAAAVAHETARYGASAGEPR
ncbi:MAG: transglutaminaseTgpA domain-containing protein [Planctomycetota bacterium]